MVSASSGSGSFSLSLVVLVDVGGGLGDGDRHLFFLFFFFGGVVCVMKISASSSSSSSTFRTCLLFFVREGPLSGVLFFLAVLMEVTLSCDHLSSSCTALGRDRVFFLGLASSWSSSSSVCGRAVMPLTSKDVRRLLEVEPLSVEVEGRGTRLPDVDGPADDSPLLGFGCARVLRDLLGRCCCVVVLLL